MKSLMNILKNKKGIASIYTILMMTFLLPLLFFTTIDLSNYIQQNRRLKNIVDNAGASAITMIDEDRLSYGQLEINQAQANDIVKRIFVESLELNNDLTPKEGSPLKEKPTYQVYVVNRPPSTGTIVTTPLGNMVAKNTSVIVYANFNVKGLFFSNMSIPMQKIGMSQVKFNNKL